VVVRHSVRTVPYCSCKTAIVGAKGDATTREFPFATRAKSSRELLVTYGAMGKKCHLKPFTYTSCASLLLERPFRVNVGCSARSLRISVALLSTVATPDRKILLEVYVGRPAHSCEKNGRGNYCTYVQYVEVLSLAATAQQKIFCYVPEPT
jgi:hypothetical protein